MAADDNPNPNYFISSAFCRSEFFQYQIRCCSKNTSISNSDSNNMHIPLIINDNRLITIVKKLYLYIIPVYCFDVLFTLM